MADVGYRVSERHIVGQDAVLLAEAHPNGIEATISDISDTGCLLIGTGVENCSEFFVLSTNENKVDVQFLCQVARRDIGQVGCRILEAKAAS